MPSLVNQHHTRNEENNIDPDDGNSWLCTACKLPIFATPFTGGGGAALLHDQCANLAKELKDCELHPQKPLFLGDNNSAATCSECSQECGSKLYYCPDSDCGLVLDVACALPIKILHRSHRHRLVAVRGCAADSSFLICGVCGVAHKATVAAAAAAVARSYFCNVCGFWIHPDCATSPNVIEHKKHEHPLVLYYDVGAAFGAQSSTPLDNINFFERSYRAPPQICAICPKDVVGTRFGIYSCLNCRDCIMHISCATSDRQSFKAVLGREAQFPSLVRLPIPDEHQSFVGYIREASSDHRDHHMQYSLEERHRDLEGGAHRFILHDDIMKSDDQDTRHHRVCDACLKTIDTPPFYSCSKCPSLFLHDYCNRLPGFLSANLLHKAGHGFAFVLHGNLGATGKSICGHCSCPHVRAFYSCGPCAIWGLNNYTLDVACALMPHVVTHETHGTGHFLRLSESSRGRDLDCDCCRRPFGTIFYECRTCQNFALHTWCAMLPKTVAHKFDPHPLHLVANGEVEMICEICENEIEDKVWCYRCEECDQSFHVDCIPCLDMVYKIKSLVGDGGTSLPTRLIRGLTLRGHGHDYCRDVADEYDDILVASEY